MQRRNLLSGLATGLITLYSRLISPLLPARCRFYPTCSAYAYGAIGTHGLVKGGFLALRRLLKCHPWHRGDMIDPVPASIDWPDIIGYNSVHRKQAGNCGCGHHQKKDKTHAKP